MSPGKKDGKKSRENRGGNGGCSLRPVCTCTPSLYQNESNNPREASHEVPTDGSLEELILEDPSSSVLEHLRPWVFYSFAPRDFRILLRPVEINSSPVQLALELEYLARALKAKAEGVFSDYDRRWSTPYGTASCIPYEDFDQIFSSITSFLEDSYPCYLLTRVRSASEELKSIAADLKEYAWKEDQTWRVAQKDFASILAKIALKYYAMITVANALLKQFDSAAKSFEKDMTVSEVGGPKRRAIAIEMGKNLLQQPTLTLETSPQSLYRWYSGLHLLREDSKKIIKIASAENGGTVEVGMYEFDYFFAPRGPVSWNFLIRDFCSVACCLILRERLKPLLIGTGPFKKSLEYALKDMVEVGNMEFRPALKEYVAYISPPESGAVGWRRFDKFAVLRSHGIAVNSLDLDIFLVRTVGKALPLAIRSKEIPIFNPADEEEATKRLKNAFRHYPSFLIYAGRTLQDVILPDEELRNNAIDGFLLRRESMEDLMECLLNNILDDPSKKNVSKSLKDYEGKDGVMELLMKISGPPAKYESGCLRMTEDALRSCLQSSDAALEMLIASRYLFDYGYGSKLKANC